MTVAGAVVLVAGRAGHPESSGRLSSRVVVVSVVSLPKMSSIFLDMKLPSVALLGMGLAVIFKFFEKPIFGPCPP